MDHRRLLHQPAARNKLICGWASSSEAKQFCKGQIAWITRPNKGGSMARKCADERAFLTNASLQQERCHSTADKPFLRNLIGED
jgi:hypothetical protein